MRDPQSSTIHPSIAAILGGVALALLPSMSNAQDALPEIEELPAITLDTPANEFLPPPPVDLQGPGLEAESSSGSAASNGNHFLADRPVPPKMVDDAISLLPAEDRWALEGLLSKARDERKIHVYTVSLPSLGAQGNDNAILKETAKRWSEDAPIFGMIVYAEDRTEPVTAYGGQLVEQIQGNYVATALREARMRGLAHPGAAEILQATSLEMLEEMEVIMNRYELSNPGRSTRPDKSQSSSGGDPSTGGESTSDDPESTSLGTSEAVNKANATGSSMIGKIKRWIPWLFLGLLGLIFLGWLIGKLLGRKKSGSSSRSRSDRDGRSRSRAEQPDGYYGGAEQNSLDAGIPAAMPQPSTAAGAAYAPPQQQQQPIEADPDPLSQSTHAAAGPVPPSFGAASPRGGERIFPSIEPVIRLQSPYGGGNNILVRFDGSGRQDPVLPSRPLAEEAAPAFQDPAAPAPYQQPLPDQPADESIPGMTKAVPPEQPKPTATEDEDEFVF